MFKKYFKYDTNTLDYRPVNFASGFSVIISTIILVFICGTFYGKHKKIESLTDYEKEIFRENHNLFGMKEAVSRITTAEGTQYNHAYYVNWRESVYDYAFYQNRYLTNVRTEAEYYAMLNASYAEASNYVEVLKKTIEKENLKSLF